MIVGLQKIIDLHTNMLIHQSSNQSKSLDIGSSVLYVIS